MAKKDKSSKAMSVDFSGVDKEIRKRSTHIPEGDYLMKITKHVKKYKNDDKSNPPYLNWTLQLTEGKLKGTPMYYMTSLKPEALFNLRNLIFAASDGKKNVAGSKVDFVPEKLYGKVVLGTVEDDEYEGKIRSRVVDVRPPSDKDTEEDEDDEDEDEEDDDDEDEDEDDELDEVDTDDI